MATTTAALPVNQALSERVAREVRARPRRCFDNASLALLRGAVPRHALYVEGLCPHPDLGIRFEHAWIELDGEIVDPTLTAVAARKHRACARYPDLEAARRQREALLRAYAEGHQPRLCYEAVARYTYGEVYAHRGVRRGGLPLTPFRSPRLAEIRSHPAVSLGVDAEQIVRIGLSPCGLQRG